MPAETFPDHRPPLIDDYSELRRALIAGTCFHSRLAHSAQPRRLLIVVPGFDTSASDYSRLIGRLLAEPEFSNTTVMPADYSSGWLTGAWAHPRQIISRMFDRVEAHLAETEPYQTQRYVQWIGLGHSFGGLLLRYAVVQLCQNDRTSDGRFAQERWPHVYRLLQSRAVRLALLSSPNRGFSELGLNENRQQRRIARLMGWGRWLNDSFGFKHLMTNGLKGDPWITNLRLSWMALDDALRPATFQFNGTDDVVVEDSDSLDVYSLPGGRSIELPGIRHGNFLNSDDLDSLPEQAYLYRQDPTVFSKNWAWEFARRQQTAGISPAPPLISSYERIRDGLRQLLQAVPTQASKPSRPGQQCQLIYLIHGIRDLGDWQEVLVQYSLSANQPATGTTYWECQPVRYGYFTAFQFLLQSPRIRIARNLADRYVQDFARILRETGLPPKCYAVAHSHGTYALVKAIVDHPQMRFERIYLCGSVVGSSFDWSSHLDQHRDQQQVGYVRNDCANGDWAVAVLSFTVGWMFWNWGAKPPLGAGGVRGFAEPSTGRLTNNRYLNGDHGVALRLWNAENIWRFLTAADSQEMQIPPHTNTRDTVTRYTRELNRRALGICWSCFAGAVVVLLLAVWILPQWGAWIDRTTGWHPGYLAVGVCTAAATWMAAVTATKV